MQKTGTGSEEEIKPGTSYTEKTFSFILYHPCNGSEGIQNFNSITPNVGICKYCGKLIGVGDGLCNVIIRML